MSTTPTNTATTTNPPRRRARRDTSLPAAARAARGDLLGYARVSTDQQNLALQLDAPIPRAAFDLAVVSNWP